MDGEVGGKLHLLSFTGTRPWRATCVLEVEPTGLWRPTGGQLSLSLFLVFVFWAR